MNTAPVLCLVFNRLRVSLGLHNNCVYKYTKMKIFSLMYIYIFLDYSLRGRWSIIFTKLRANHWEGTVRILRKLPKKHRFFVPFPSRSRAPMKREHFCPEKYLIWLITKLLGILLSPERDNDHARGRINSVREKEKIRANTLIIAWCGICSVIEFNYSSIKIIFLCAISNARIYTTLLCFSLSLSLSHPLEPSLAKTTCA